MKKEETFKWDDKKFVEFYADSADIIILKRQRLIRLLLEIFLYLLTVFHTLRFDRYQTHRLFRFY